MNGIRSTIIRVVMRIERLRNQWVIWRLAARLGWTQEETRAWLRDFNVYNSTFWRGGK